LKAWLALSLPETGRWKATRGKEKRRLLKMEFRTFVNDMIRIPCQVARTGRLVICRVLNGNQMQTPSFRHRPSPAILANNFETSAKYCSAQPRMC
jgi:hypothetical protein